MAANDYTRTVSITPISTAYSWDTPPSWITITQVGSTDNWTIRIAVNTAASRTATLTVRHDNTSTTDTIAVSQAAGTSSGSGGGAGPTATPAPSPTSVPNPTATASPTATPVPPTPVPSATPIPPTPIPPTSSGGAGYAMSFPNGDTSFFIDDTQGAGNGTDAVTFGMTGTGSEGSIVPTIISQDSRITVSMQYGVYMGGLHRGSINITSNDPGSSTPQGLILSNLVLAHALDNSATASLSGNLTQFNLGSHSPTPFPSATPFAFPTATPYSSGGGGGGGGCHLAGEMITMSNGEKVAIENISAGDSLLSVKINGMSNEELAYESWSSNINAFSIDYTSVNIQTVKVDTYTSYYNFNNDALKITFEHPILVKTSDNLVLFKIAKDVNVGDNFLNENNEWISIVTKVLIEDVAPFTTYTIDVEPEDTYFANGVLVHNIVNEKEYYL
jgi:hypothetical protein